MTGIQIWVDQTEIISELYNYPRLAANVLSGLVERADYEDDIKAIAQEVEEAEDRARLAAWLQRLADHLNEQED